MKYILHFHYTFPYIYRNFVVHICDNIFKLHNFFLFRQISLRSLYYIRNSKEYLTYVTIIIMKRTTLRKQNFTEKKCNARRPYKNDIISRLFIFFILFIKTKLIMLERQHIHTNVVCSCAHKIARKYCLYIIYCCYTNRVVRITNFSLHLFWV